MVPSISFIHSLFLLYHATTTRQWRRRRREKTRGEREDTHSHTNIHETNTHTLEPWCALSPSAESRRGLKKWYFDPADFWASRDYEDCWLQIQWITGEMTLSPSVFVIPPRVCDPTSVFSAHGFVNLSSHASLFQPLPFSSRSPFLFATYWLINSVQNDILWSSRIVAACVGINCSSESNEALFNEWMNDLWSAGT